MIYYQPHYRMIVYYRQFPQELHQIVVPPAIVFERMFALQDL